MRADRSVTVARPDRRIAFDASLRCALIAGPSLPRERPFPVREIGWRTDIRDEIVAMGPFRGAHGESGVVGRLDRVCMSLDIAQFLIAAPGLFCLQAIAFIQRFRECQSESFPADVWRLSGEGR